MPFEDPLGFSKVAKFLNERVDDFSEEGVFRTIISRLYYSSFHSIRDRIYGRSKRSVNHVDLQEKAGIAAKTKGRERYITHYLSQLETMRDRADYDIHTAIGKEEVLKAYEVFFMIEDEFHEIWD